MAASFAALGVAAGGGFGLGGGTAGLIDLLELREPVGLVGIRIAAHLVLSC